SASPPHRPVCLSSASAPPVKGVLVLTTNTRNPKIHKKRTFLQKRFKSMRCPSHLPSNPRKTAEMQDQRPIEISTL
ncbi:hypothetical protein, partial [Tritonibacter aquimaris]|uniref:hypothetical protein n=1 Tax=Tritonibacter aquimaris TaxID=2663379 RepID=UPI001BE490BC